MRTQSTYDERFLWRQGSLCSVYSRSHKRWYEGVIKEIFIESESQKEWLSVHYNRNRNTKNIQRLCRDIKPIRNTSRVNRNTVWMIGSNKYSEGGISFDSCTTLTLCPWSQHIEIGNIIGIERGLGFNIFAVGTHYDELVVFGFIKKYASHRYSLAIPNCVRLQILSYYGANYNRYWSCGANDFGQCSIGNSRTAQRNIAQITYPMANISAIRIGCTSRNVFWIKNDGTLYINGRNLQKHIASMEITLPIPCHMTRNENKNVALKCVDAASSHYHCLVVCDEGSVWSLGRGTFGELGHGRHPKLFSEFFAKIRAFKEQHVRHVSAGNYFSLFLCDDGNVWSCGKNDCAQCGLGYFDQDRNRLPTKIDYFERTKVKITQIECGDSHSIALSSYGKVYCWGKNQNGQCAINKSIEELVTIPTLIKCLSTQRMALIRAGSCHSGCVSTNNEYYLWGCNHRNECCLSDGNCQTIATPHSINQYVVNITNANRIVAFTLGTCNTMIIVEQ